MELCTLCVEGPAPALFFCQGCYEAGSCHFPYSLSVLVHDLNCSRQNWIDSEEIPTEDSFVMEIVYVWAAKVTISAAFIILKHLCILSERIRKKKGAAQRGQCLALFSHRSRLTLYSKETDTFRHESFDLLSNWPWDETNYILALPPFLQFTVPVMEHGSHPLLTCTVSMSITKNYLSDVQGHFSSLW